MKIQTSRNYNLFKFDKANRSIGKLKPMIESMKKYGWRSAYPMDVYPNESGSGYIIRDGQHRFESAKTLGIPVKFVIEKNDAKASEINRPQRAWNILDYVTGGCNDGNPHFHNLLEFHQSHSLPIGLCASLLAGCTGVGGGGGRGGVSEAIKCGRFVVKDQPRAELIASVVSQVNGVVPWNATTRNLVASIALLTHVSDFNPSVLVDKVRKFPHILKPQATTSLFLENVEELYNHAARQRVPLKFLAEEAAKGRNPLFRK